MTEPDRISVSSIYGDRRGPLVQIIWGSNIAQLTPQEARAHALSVLEAAEATVYDAFLLEFLAEKVGIMGKQMVAIMADFRNWRRERGL